MSLEGGKIRNKIHAKNLYGNKWRCVHVWSVIRAALDRGDAAKCFGDVKDLKYQVCKRPSIQEKKDPFGRSHGTEITFPD